MKPAQHTQKAVELEACFAPHVQRKVPTLGIFSLLPFEGAIGPYYCSVE